MSLSVGDQILPAQLATGAHQLQQQLTAIGDPEVQQAPGSQGDGRTGHRLQEVDLLGSAPLHGHLVDQIEEIDLRVESAFRIGGQLVHLLQDGKLLGLQGIAAGCKSIQCLAIPEEHRLLGFMDDQLRTQVEVLNGVLPDQGVCIALIFDDGGQTVLLDSFGLQPLHHIVFMVAHRAGVGACVPVGGQTDAALGAAKLRHFNSVQRSLHLLAAHRAADLGTVGLVMDKGVAAMGALPGSQLLGTHIDGVTAGAIDLLSRKNTGLCLYILAAAGAFHYKFSHFLFPPHYSSTRSSA